RKRRLESKLAHLLRQIEGMTARRRAEDDGALAPLRAADRAVARAPGSLLAPRLAAAAGNLADPLCVMRALLALRELPAHHARQDIGARRQAEYLIRQVYLA